eukprot:Sspe_Gene.28284::Locus_12711_Transcript_1_2_Confidence_0.750_Length_5388::g.28284::m.28284/K07374/TUBA; tubulin alpha
MGKGGVDEDIAAKAVKEVTEVLKRVKEANGDKALVDVVLEAATQVSEAALLRRTAAKWFDQRMAKDDDTDMKFGDGIANATQATPEMLTKIRYYDDDYRPPIQVQDLYTNIGSWETPQGKLWGSSAIEDLAGNGGLIVKYHSCNQPSDLVVPLYLYSASQKGQRYVWAVWVVPKDDPEAGKWKVVRSKALESAYQAAHGGSIVLDAAWFSKKLGLARGVLPSDPVLMTRVEDGPPSSEEGYEVLMGHMHSPSAPPGCRDFFIMRYSNLARGDGQWSPVYDTIAWLPPPALNGDKRTFNPPLSELPPPGVIEYLYSRGSSETLEWPKEGHGWYSQYALGSTAQLMVEKCFAEPNQQDYNRTLHENSNTLIAALRGTESEAYTKLEDALIAWGMTKGDVKDVPTPTDDTKEVIKNLVAQIVEVKLAKDKKPTPASLAHALEIQLLEWGGHKHLVALSGANPCITSATGKVVVLNRLNETFDDQIFWQLNRAMRMKQFGVEPHIQVNPAAGIAAGNYKLQGDVPEEPGADVVYVQDAPTKYRAQRIDGSWVFTNPKKGTTIDVAPEHCWFELGTWLVPQIRPLVWYIDAALAKAKTVRGSKAPAGLQTYRGLKDVVLDRKIYDAGKVVLWGAYSSTSGDRGIASAFAQSDDAKAAVFSLVGKTCVCIANWSRFGREREWLYPPNSSFQVTSALSEEHAELAGKKNLQIFAMQEVNEFDALIVYMRTLVNLVVGTVQGSAMPKHVEQLFKIMQCITGRDLNAALKATCDPSGLVLKSAEGASLARMLLSMGARQHVLSTIAHESVGPHPEILMRLVHAGAAFEGKSGAKGWMCDFETNLREINAALQDLERREMAQRLSHCITECTERNGLADYMNDRKRLDDLQFVRVTEVKGAYAHFNGYYKRKEGTPVVFEQINPVRLGVFCEITLDPTRGKWGLWVLMDSLTREALLAKKRPEGWNGWLPVSTTLDGKWRQDESTQGGGGEYPFVTVIQEDPQAGGYGSRPGIGWDAFPKWNIKGEIRDLTRIYQEEKRRDEADEEFWSPLLEGIEHWRARGPHPSVAYGVDPNLLPVSSKYAEATSTAFWKTRASRRGGNNKPLMNMYTDKADSGFAFDSSGGSEVGKSLAVAPLLVPRLADSLRPYVGFFSSRGTGLGYDYSEAVHEKLRIRRQLLPWQIERRKAFAKLFDDAEDVLDRISSDSSYEAGVAEYMRKAAIRETASQVFDIQAAFRIILTVAPDISPQYTQRHIQDMLKEDPEGGKLRDHLAVLQKEVDRLFNMPAEERGKVTKEMLWALDPHRDPRLKDKPSIAVKGPVVHKKARKTRPETVILPGLSRGIVTLHIGQAGCQIGAACWDVFSKEHGIGGDARPLHRFNEVANLKPNHADYLFNETFDGKYRPRAIFCDLDPGVVSQAFRTYHQQELFDSADNVSGKQDACDNFAIGFYNTEHDMVRRQLIDRIRKNMEVVDLVEGFHVYHSGSGGTGSGLTAWLLSELNKDYPKKTRMTFSLVPSLRVSNSVVGVYNFMLQQHALLENSDLNVFLDNESLYYIAIKLLGVADPDYRCLNSIVAEVTSSLTGAIRLPAIQRLKSLQHITTNLVLYPRLHCVVPSFSPFMSSSVSITEPQNQTKALLSLASYCFHPSHYLLSVNPRGTAKNCTMLMNFRGELEPKDALVVTTAASRNREIQFANYTACPFKTSITPFVGLHSDPDISGVKYQPAKRTMALYSNTTSIGPYIYNMLSKTDLLYSKRAFVHWYVSEGMEEGEMSESFVDAHALVKDY